MSFTNISAEDKYLFFDVYEILRALLGKSESFL